MSILIADSGSTKTDWCLIEESGEKQSFQTIGLNPFFISSELIITELKMKLLPKLRLINPNSVNTVYFYGAGCSTIDRCKLVKVGIVECFKTASVHVFHDLLAAARALCRKEQGIAAILGTGSNSCYYDGNNIIENVLALGYVLGDEGSGAHIGKSLVQAYLNKEMPDEIKYKFKQFSGLNKDELLEGVYNNPFPNKFLAGFSKFADSNIDNGFVYSIVKSCLESFFVKHIEKYSKSRELPLHIVGSVGIAFKPIIEGIADSRSIRLGVILKSPMDGLIRYHS